MSLSHLLTPENISRHVLRLLPSPQALGHGLRLIPPEWQGRILTKLMNRMVVSALPSETLVFLEQRRLAIEVEDLGLRWVFMGTGSRLQALPVGTTAEATIRGKVLDLLLLASQLEDADTLFFQRRLTMTGDTALGLETRNVLDQLPWERLTPGLRIALNRLARVAQAAHEARRK
ncbi:MAG: ubiquinone anaerobic biosynthesis accessory factor UbiT [Burkholderiales bacterium]|nr:sterol-binding protein [Ferrovum sp.]